MLLHVALACCVVSFASNFVAASPSPSIPGLVARQATAVFVPAPLPSPTSITFNNTIQTGNDIREVENCTVSIGGSELASTVVTPSASASSIEISIIPAPTGTLAVSMTPSPIVAAAFTMPGRSLEVLPVGLGIYGGVTFITFMFVVFVTYERVQYRKVKQMLLRCPLFCTKAAVKQAFQQRRMIEQRFIANANGTKKAIQRLVAGSGGPYQQHLMLP
ncbi:hypothetical protein V8B97DRAFT_740731 [Scleroderma yunnanense]